jgi:hypothetical protein
VVTRDVTPSGRPLQHARPNFPQIDARPDRGLGWKPARNSLREEGSATAVYRVAINFPFDSALPRDVVTINPHYFGDDAQALVDRLKANLISDASLGANLPFTIKAYDAVKAPPSYPLATATNGTGFTTTGVPREVALCLSYYSTWNRPGYRGRLFLPATLVGSGMGQRPSPTQRDGALRWKNLLTNGLPAGTNWVVWSRKQQKSYGVTNVWVDDEWDTMRSRGLKPTTRTVGTVP